MQSKNLARMANYAEPEVDYVFTYSPSGQLESRELIVSDTVDATQVYRVYDGVGNMRFGYEGKSGQPHRPPKTCGSDAWVMHEEHADALARIWLGPYWRPVRHSCPL